jgi:hypothetical protein
MVKDDSKECYDVIENIQTSVPQFINPSNILKTISVTFAMIDNQDEVCIFYVNFVICDCPFLFVCENWYILFSVS